MIVKEEGIYFINQSNWESLYKATSEGDILRAPRNAPDAWRPVYSINARCAVWNLLNSKNHRIPWREDNGKDVEISGFERREGKLCFWYVCKTCDTPYTDKPELVKQLQDQGCEQPNCTNKK